MKNFVQSGILPLVLGSAAAVLASTAPAQALDFTFSFSNSNGTVPGTVTGVIKGLQANTTSAATEIDLTSYPTGGSVSATTGLGINPNSSGNLIYSSTGGGWASTTSTNSFTVNSSNQVTNAIFYIEGAFGTNTSGATNTGYGSEFYINSYPNNNYLSFGNGNADVSNLCAYTCVSTPGLANITFTPVSSAVPFNIPGGATIPTLGSVLALGILRKARKFRSNNFSNTVTEKVN